MWRLAGDRGGDGTWSGRDGDTCGVNRIVLVQQAVRCQAGRREVSETTGGVKQSEYG